MAFPKLKLNSPVKEVTDLLNELGLNKYESSVYFNLISEGISTAKNVSNITGIPYGKVYEIINSLADKGFCIVLPSKPMKCRAISPQKALELVKKRTNEKLAHIEGKFESILEPIFEKTKSFLDSESKIWVVTGRYNVVKKIEESICNSEKNINIHCSANSFSRLVIHKTELCAAKKRGVQINIATELSNVSQIDLDALSFCNIKSVNKSPNNFFSFDGNVSLMVEPIPDDDNIKYGRDIATHISGNSFTELLDTFFENSFKCAKIMKTPVCRSQN